MSTPFDPYHVWLGIPPDEQPPNHYRLLGIKLFEDNPDVISDAAEQRMAHVRTKQLSRYVGVSQKILNEVARAKVCLLTPNEKAAYDAMLRQELEKKASQQSEYAAIADVVGGKSPPLPPRISGSKPMSWRVLTIVGGGGAVLLVLLLVFVFSGKHSPDVAKQDPSVAVHERASGDLPPKTVQEPAKPIPSSQPNPPAKPAEPVKEPPKLTEVTKAVAIPTPPAEPEKVADELERAQAVLKANPTNPQANLTVGKHLCFAEDKWAEGLPMLAQGSDATLKELATAELKGGTSPEQQMKLGNAWWDFAGVTTGLAWKSSQQRAVYWHREALPHLEGSAKADIEKKLKGLDEQPPDFDVLARLAKAEPDESGASARCTDLTMEVSKEVGHGAGHAGLELKGVRFLEVVVTASPQFRWGTPHSFAGFMVDYHAGAGYAKRVALSIGVFDKDRDDKSPHWGKNAAPDEYVDLGRHDQYALDLQQWAPPDWDGRVWFTTTLQATGRNTFITAQLVPLARQPESQTITKPRAKGSEERSDSPTRSTKGKRRNKT